MRYVKPRERFFCYSSPWLRGGKAGFVIMISTSPRPSSSEEGDITAFVTYWRFSKIKNEQFCDLLGSKCHFRLKVSCSSNVGSSASHIFRFGGTDGSVILQMRPDHVGSKPHQLVSISMRLTFLVGSSYDPSSWIIYSFCCRTFPQK